MNKVTDKIQRTLSKSRLITLICVKIRNQANAVIGFYLGESANSSVNGEYSLLKQLAPLCTYFVDVGANKGEWTEHFIKYSDASGSLFEPSSSAFSILSEKFSNSCLDLHRLAVADYEGTALYIEEPDCGETSSIAETHIPCAISPHEVSVCTIDSMFLDSDTNIDYLKIDVEGFDCKVLLGAKGMLAAKRIKYVQFEYNSCWVLAGHSLSQTITYLNSLRYDIFIIRSTGLHPVNYETWGDYYRYSNFFACMHDDKTIQPIIKYKI